MMMEHEERGRVTDRAFNFWYEHVEGEMQRRLGLPINAWEPIGRGESITTRARAHLARLAESGNGEMARYVRVEPTGRPRPCRRNCPDPMRDRWSHG